MKISSLILFIYYVKYSCINGITTWADVLQFYWSSPQVPKKCLPTNRPKFSPDLYKKNKSYPSLVVSLPQMIPFPFCLAHARANLFLHNTFRKGAKSISPESGPDTSSLPRVEKSRKVRSSCTFITQAQWRDGGEKKEEEINKK